MFTTVVRLYNQSLEYFTRNWCTIYTLFMILQLQWWIKVDNDFIIKTLKKAKKDKVFFESRGAYFSQIYIWFATAIFNRTQVRIIVKALDINSKEFEEYIKNWYAFGLWLKNGNSKYFEAVVDWNISIEEIDSIKAKWGWYWHNHTYYNGFIIDSVWKLADQTIKISLEELRYAVKVWIYYPTARTLVMEDKLLEKWLKAFQHKDPIINKDVSKLSPEDKKASERASQLRQFKK